MKQNIFLKKVKKYFAEAQEGYIFAPAKQTNLVCY